MIGTVRDSDITLASRYECKYLVDPILVPEIRQFLRSFVDPDRFAALRDGYRYPICSLYLDTDHLALYHQVVGGEKKRFKLRARSYSDQPSAPIFLEVKRKIDNIVRKRRVRLDRDLVAAMFLRGYDGLAPHLPADFLDDLNYFNSHARLTGAKPLVKVKYLREAYESRGGDPVRITIDTQLTHSVSLDGDLTHARGPWIPISMSQQILEIKFTDRYPTWVQDLVRLFGLRQQSVPKYIMSVDHMLMQGRAAALSVAGFTLPPARI